jgi:hypothetical protein
MPALDEYTDHDRSVAEAFLEGRRAADAGLDERSNPYFLSNNELHPAWEAGLRIRRQMIARNKGRGM